MIITSNSAIFCHDGIMLPSIDGATKGSYLYNNDKIGIIFNLHCKGAVSRARGWFNKCMFAQQVNKCSSYDWYNLKNYEYWQQSMQRAGVVLFDYFAEMYFASKLNCKPEAIIEVVSAII